MRIPIATKLIVITVLLLIGVTVPIALRSSKFFEDTSRIREESINLDFAAAKATEIENILNNLVDKTRTSGTLLYKTTTQEPGTNASTLEELELGFQRDKNFISLEIYKIEGTAVQRIAQRTKDDILKSFKLDSNYIVKVRAQQQFPFRSVAQGTLEIVNGSNENAPAMYTLGIPLITDPQGRISHIALADIQLATIQKPFSELKERTYYTVDRRGILVAHSDEQKAIKRMNMNEYEIVSAAQESVTPRGQKPYFDEESEQKFFAAYAKTSYGLTIFSLIAEDIILEPAREVKRNAFFIAGMFLSAALFIVFLFSMSLTSPIETLAELIGIVSKGNFDVKASKQIDSLFQDEVVELAQAFDNMTEGLKERDKVKNLFNKFHGSSVTEDLMKGDVGVGGQSKQVVIFFSDIRGFTAFSEKRSPEEVVAMLNEYFAIMVGIINRHGGVVDKFIGDAIMAVWGAPKGTDKDAHKAVRACIEMRKGLAELNVQRIARGQPAINIGMGLHYGTAISGTIGSDERMEYTVIGNTVNTGSRIEASTKAFGSDLLISDTVVEKIGEDFLLEYAGAAEVKGRSEALKLYKVRGYKDESGQMVEVRTEYSDYEAEKADKVKIAG